MNLEQYKNEFIAAQQRSAKFGLSPDPLHFSQTKFLTDEHILRFANVLQNYFNQYNHYREVAHNCLNINLALHSILNDELNLRNHFTLGYINDGTHDFFKFSESDLNEWVKTGIPDPYNANLHAWLTLDSMEIIDATFGTTLAVLTDDETSVGGIIHCLPSEFAGELQFHPMAVGSEILFKIGAIIGIKFT